METTLAVAFGSFLAGWFSRDWSSPRVAESTTKCICDCNWQGVVNQEGGSSGLSWIVTGLVVLLLVAICGNAALALKISLKDPKTGSDKELTVSVKGKSKGFYGVARPLQITG
jgi:hypothetical protein